MPDKIATFNVDFDTRPGIESFEFNLDKKTARLEGKSIKLHETDLGWSYTTGNKTIIFSGDGTSATVHTATPICQVNKSAPAKYTWSETTIKP